MSSSSFLILTAVLIGAVFCSEYQYECPEEGEEYRECGTPCPVTCEQPEVRPCILRCQPGCFCKKGLFRDSSSGKCVTEETCEYIISGQYNYLP